MDLFSAIQVSSSALSAERVRINVIASNLANVNTTRTEEGGPYKKKSVIFAAVPTFQDTLRDQMAERIKSVRVAGIKNDQSQPRLVFEPAHPDANDNGYVAMPNINTLEEMVSMLSATRSYEANITVINAVKSMAIKAMELGR